LTLAFLGDIPPDGVEDLAEALAEIDAPPRFEVRLDGLAFFGGQPPGVLAATVRPDPVLESLHDAVRRAARAAGLTVKRQRFRPHVTLLRLPRPLSPEHEAALASFMAKTAPSFAAEFTADEFCLYRSILRPEGARHEELAFFPLPAPTTA
ncbi:MAG TPA: RNA 2',3'-cyclic phosphodiesterase, partial [Hyphomicrobiales bacterium]|nr:RNA 2',3'-cyclic phosphodiesterase [Hyphomicrobiales bacterium]